jgi:hypothetical protein
MPADDAIKPAVVSALVKDGWTITHDPYPIRYAGDRLLVDLGAARAVVGAERGEERIAVEIKSFLSGSLLNEFQTAFGQYFVYATLMREVDPGRRLVVAVGEEIHRKLLAKPTVTLVLRQQPVPFVVVRLATEEVVAWTS